MDVPTDQETKTWPIAIFHEMFCLKQLKNSFLCLERKFIRIIGCNCCNNNFNFNEVPSTNRRTPENDLSQFWTGTRVESLVLRVIEIHYEIKTLDWRREISIWGGQCWTFLQSGLLCLTREEIHYIQQRRWSPYLSIFVILANN